MQDDESENKHFTADFSNTSSVEVSKDKNENGRVISMATEESSERNYNDIVGFSDRIKREQTTEKNNQTWRLLRATSSKRSCMVKTFWHGHCTSSGVLKYRLNMVSD